MVYRVVRLIGLGSVGSRIRRESVRSEDSDSRASLFIQSKLSVLVLGTCSKCCSGELVYERLSYHFLTLERAIVLAKGNTEHLSLLLGEVRHEANVGLIVDVGAG